MPDMHYVIIPYRNRAEQLSQLLDKLPGFLDSFGEYQILIVEQADCAPFNLGYLFNCGVDYLLHKEISVAPLDTLYLWDCDILAERINLTVGHNQCILFRDYNNPESKLRFAKIIGFNFNLFLKANGYNNWYWGYGGDDHDIKNKIQKVGGKALYKESKQISLAGQEFDDASYFKFSERNEWLRRVSESAPINLSGLNTCNYKLLREESRFKITHIGVELLHECYSQ